MVFVLKQIHALSQIFHKNDHWKKLNFLCKTVKGAFTWRPEGLISPILKPYPRFGYPKPDSNLIPPIYSIIK